MHEVCIPHSTYTSCMGTARVIQEEEADTRIKESSMTSGGKERWHEGEKSQTRR